MNSITQSDKQFHRTYEVQCVYTSSSLVGSTQGEYCPQVGAWFFEFSMWYVYAGSAFFIFVAIATEKVIHYILTIRTKDFL